MDEFKDELEKRGLMDKFSIYVNLLASKRKSIGEPAIKLYKTKVLLPSEILEKGKEERGKRDGTGPHKDSAQASISNEGKRKEAGEKCPHDEEEDDEGQEKKDKKKSGSEKRPIKG